MKSKIWPQRHQKWPLDLNDLGRGWVDFFKNYIFRISASSWEKWAIARFSSKSFKISNLCYFLVASEDKELKNGIWKSLNRKLSYSSYWSNIYTYITYTVASEVIAVFLDQRFRGMFSGSDLPEKYFLLQKKLVFTIFIYQSQHPIVNIAKSETR